MTIAAFDFDGTLTKRDTFLPFALFVVGPARFFSGLLLLIPSALLYCFGLKTRQDLKEKTIAQFLKGMPYADLEREAVDFVQGVLIPKLLKKRALEQVEWHKKEGHRLILISASPDLYLHPFAERLGIHDVLGSRLKLDSQGRITGKLEGKNCRGQEKVDRLKALLGSEKTYELYAYGDSPGDRELLNFADHRFYRKL